MKEKLKANWRKYLGYSVIGLSILQDIVIIGFGLWFMKIAPDVDVTLKGWMIMVALGYGPLKQMIFALIAKSLIDYNKKSYSNECSCEQKASEENSEGGE